MHILVTGARGQLGREVRRLLETGTSEIGPVPAVYAAATADYVDLAELDIAHVAATDAWFAAHPPYDLVINCAAMTDVDGCESDFATAFAANAQGPMNLALACAGQGARLVQVSTDYVFAGDDPTPRTEADRPAPISAYGRSKLAGEGLALAANPRTFVVRTAWLYGYEGRNFVRTMLALGSSHGEVTVVDDQLGNPTSANDVAHEILALGASDAYGVYHCTGEGVCSWADFAEAIMAGAGLDCQVRRCSSAQWLAAHPESAARPAYSALENAQLAATVGNDMRPWQEALASYLARVRALGHARTAGAQPA